MVRPSRIPAPLRFPLVATLSLTLSVLLYSASAQYTNYELGKVSRRLDRWEEAVGLVAWRWYVQSNTILLVSAHHANACNTVLSLQLDGSETTTAMI